MCPSQSEFWLDIFKLWLDILFPVIRCNQQFHLLTVQNVVINTEAKITISLTNTVTGLACASK